MFWSRFQASAAEFSPVCLSLSGLHKDMNTLEKTNVFYQADRLRFIQCFRNVATHQVTTRDGNRPTTPVGNPRCPTENYFSFWKPKGEPTNRTNSPKQNLNKGRFSKWFFFCLFWGGSASKKKQIKLDGHVWDDVSDSKKPFQVTEKTTCWKTNPNMKTKTP